MKHWAIRWMVQSMMRMTMQIRRINDEKQKANKKNEEENGKNHQRVSGIKMQRSCEREIKFVYVHFLCIAWISMSDIRIRNYVWRNLIILRLRSMKWMATREPLAVLICCRFLTRATLFSSIRIRKTMMLPNDASMVRWWH